MKTRVPAPRSPAPRRVATTLASIGLLAMAACNKPAEAPSPAEPVTAGSTATSTTVGGVAMNPADTIMTNAAKAPNLTTLVSAIQAAGLADTLAGTGPYTVFAPDNAAFEKIPVADRTALLTPAGKKKLTRILAYHVVPGRLTVADLATQAQARGGRLALTTVEGAHLTVNLNPDGSLTLTDAKGGAARINQADALQSNGVVHVVDTVLAPR